jgi:hypothetical protein
MFRTRPLLCPTRLVADRGLDGRPLELRQRVWDVTGPRRFPQLCRLRTSEADVLLSFSS